MIVNGMAEIEDGAMGFAGSTAVVTGGAGGIGRAVCAGFAAAGASVAIVDCGGVAEAAIAVRAVAPRARVEGYSCDVADASAVAELMELIHDKLDGPHVLVTLAGGSLGTPRRLGDIKPSDVNKVLDVNLKGTLYCCQAAAPLMVASGGGAIVTCSSITARQSSPGAGAPYAAAKAAILGLTRHLAGELGPSGIRVNAVVPGDILTDRLRARFEALPEQEQRGMLDDIPLGRMPELREIVEPILFLAGAGASFVTGAVLDVNGGRYMPA